MNLVTTSSPHIRGTERTDKIMKDVLIQNNIMRYGGYGWGGFDKPKVDTNTYIPLLGSVMPKEENPNGINEGWTYEAVCDFVQKFWCGVGVANGNTTDLSDSTFVVELRLTNPENTDEYIVCNKVTYNFATKTSTFVDIVYSAEELFNALMNGSTNVELGTNIDLNQSVVVPGN